MFVCIEWQELNIPEKDVEHLLVSLILDNRVQGHIDQVNQLLELGDRYALHSLSLLSILPSVLACDFHLLLVIMKCQHSSLGHFPKSNLQSQTSSCLYVPTRSKGLKKYTAIDTWNTQLKSLYQTVTTRIGWTVYAVGYVDVVERYSRLHCAGIPSITAELYYWITLVPALYQVTMC